MLAHVDLSLKPRFNEVEVAQAAGKRILGPNARVGGEWWSWHSAGAQHWYDVDHDLLNFTLLDPATYLSNMDAFEICSEPGEHSRLFDWYADGKLKLRGFFLGQSNVHLRCLQLSPHPASPLLGYAEWEDQLYRFQENPGGDYEVLSAICPDPHNDWHSPWASSFSVAFAVPPDPSGAPMWLVTVLAPRSYMSPAGPRRPRMPRAPWLAAGEHSNRITAGPWWKPRAAMIRPCVSTGCRTKCQAT